MSKSKDFQKVFSKNYLKMNNFFWSNPSLFMPGILGIRKKFKISGELPIIDPAKDRDHYSKLIKIASQKFKAFCKNNEDKLSSFYKDLKEIRKPLHLGREWNATFARIVTSGIFLPPPFSVFIFENEEDKIIIFELNKDTTQDDLNLAWKNIKDIRKRMYGKTRAVYPTADTITNFKYYTEASANKFNNPLKEAALGEKYKNTDLDIAGELFADAKDISAETDEKRANKLKVNRHRFKKTR
jgi:hypothetical protein